MTDTAPTFGDDAVDALYRAVRGAESSSTAVRLEKATQAVAAACNALAEDFAPEVMVLASEDRPATLSIDCTDATWLDQAREAIDAHDGEAWLVVELSGTCEVSAEHVDDAILRLDGVTKVELRGAPGTRIDASSWADARDAESVAVEVTESDEIVVRELSFEGITTRTAGSDAGAIRVTDSSKVVISDNSISNVRVVYDEADDVEETNAFGVKVVGTADGESAQILLSGNTVSEMETGQSENVTLAGNVRAFAVIGNVVFSVDNIGIDLIGGEDYAGAQARDGLVCGNALGDQSDFNPAYADGDAAGAGIYLDGGGTASLVALNLVEGYARGFELGAEQANPAIVDAHLFGNISIASRAAGLLMGSLAERVDPSEPTDRNTLVERHLIVDNPSADVGSCTSDEEPGAEEGAAQCEPGSVSRLGVQVCSSPEVPDSAASCDWEG